MKTISKVRIHPFFYLFSFICLSNGLFKDYIYITFIVLFHELGHIIMGLIYKWDITKIIILPFGSLTIFDTFINVKLKQEFMVTIMGPLFQIYLFLIQNSKFTYYNKMLLLFNLIPIIPLDGSKIINIILNKFISFKKSLFISIMLSFFLIFYLIKQNNSLIGLLIIILLLKKGIEMLFEKKYIFNRFLLERYLYHIPFNKVKKIKKIKQMKRDYRHLFHIKNKYYTEKEILSKMFDK